MNVTEDVVRDLLPAYFSGEGSPDTRDLVEAYFGEHPAFEATARRDASVLHDFEEVVATPADPAREKTALDRAKAVLRWQRILLAVASTLTLNAVSIGFSFETSSGRVLVHWLALPGQAQAIVVLLALAAVFWVLYFRISQRVRDDILG